MIVFIQVYLCTVIFWHIVFASGILRIESFDKETKEQIETPLWFVISICYGWIIFIPWLLLKDKEDKQ